MNLPIITFSTSCPVRYYTTQSSLSRDSHQSNKNISFFLSLDSKTARTKISIEKLKAFLGMFLGGRDML